MYSLGGKTARDNVKNMLTRYGNHLYSRVFFCWEKFVEYEDLICFNVRGTVQIYPNVTSLEINVTAWIGRFATLR